MPKNADYTIEQRLMTLEQHIADLNFKGKNYTKANLLKYLKSKGHNIGQQTLENDLRELSSNNQFVANIGKYYSQYMQDISDDLKRVKRDARKIHDAKWTQSRQVKKQVLGRDNQIIDVTEITTTKEIASPKLSALKLIADVDKMLIELASGKNLEISAAQWIIREKELQQEIKTLQSKLNESTKSSESVTVSH